MVTQSVATQLHIDFKNNAKKTIKKLIDSKEVIANSDFVVSASAVYVCNLRHAYMLPLYTSVWFH
jgi:hypothetical protein